MVSFASRARPARSASTRGCARPTSKRTPSAASSNCGSASTADHGVVLRDAPLFVGKAPVALAGAFVEKDAELRFQWTDTTTVDGRVYLAFDFEDFMITAPDGQRLWIAKDLVDRR